jgi:hypothetical protein
MSAPGNAQLLGPADGASATPYDAVLDHKAPYLIEKLVNDRIVDTAEEGEALFAEVKRYLLLSHLDPGVSWSMHSMRVDEAWHQFVLFTREYVDFCNRCFGAYMHHSPSNAPKSPGEEEAKTSTFQSFRVRYEALFGGRLPDVWFDDRSVTMSRRVINDHAGRSHVSVDGGMVSLVGADGTIVLSVSDIAREALGFMSRTGSFYVRELPGHLTDDEKVGLVATLVEHRLLRVAP